MDTVQPITATQATPTAVIEPVIVFTEMRIPTSDQVVSTEQSGGTNRICTSLSSDNEYIPIHSLSEGELVRRGDHKVLIYKFHVPGSQLQSHKYNEFCEALRLDMRPREHSWCRYRHSSHESDYVANKGTIIFRSNPTVPMMMMAVKHKYLFDIAPKERDLSKFALVINNDFINDAEHFKVYRNVNKLFIEKIADKIDMVYTNNIMSVLFNDKSFKPPKFLTIQQSLDYANKMNSILSEHFKKEIYGANTRRR
jgi:hypothetical protein